MAFLTTVWALAGLAGSAAASAGPPAVIPFPGTPDASPASQIIFSALSPSALKQVTVRGSASGRHAGRLTALPDASGTAFVPARPFVPGERVTVSAALGPRQAGAVSDTTSLRFSFGIARGAEVAAPATLPARPARVSRNDRQSYRSEPQLHPARVGLTTRADPGAGDVFLTPHNAGQKGAMIVNGRGQLVWFLPTGRRTAFNLEVQHYRGQPALTWWQGRLAQGHGVHGQDVIMNSSYRRVAVLHAGYGYSSDLHEFQLMPHGRALIDCYVPVRGSETSVGGPSNGVIVDNVIQKLDIKTGRVLWEWHALGHVPLTATYNWVPSDSFPFDYFHLNSIQQLPDGKLIISARNTWAVYMIDEHTGRVVWTLGGRYSSYRMGSGTNFEWQHDARLHRHGLLTLFDDAALPEEESESSAKELRIDVNSGTVSLVHRYTHSPGVLAGSQGSVQVLADGNVFVGWGSAPNFSEYTPEGRQILDGGFRLGVNSYRAYRFPWSGRPLTRPSLAVVAGSRGTVRLYASWNGATQVASWEIEDGRTRHDLVPVAARATQGFETAMVLHARSRFFAVEALDSQGRLLGRSYLIPMPTSGVGSG